LDGGGDGSVRQDHQAQTQTLRTDPMNHSTEELRCVLQ
jgi:hypothetical protein